MKPMKMQSNFPGRIRQLEPYSDRFDAFRMQGEGCQVFFAGYPAGTKIEPHSHDTDNWGVITRGEMVIIMEGREHHFPVGAWYHVPAGMEHAAWCDEDTEEIEFWFEASEENRQQKVA